MYERCRVPAVARRAWIERRGERAERSRRARWTERAERRRPSERLAAPPRESRDVTESPLFFAIPRRAPRARKVPVPPRGSLLSGRDALLLSATATTGHGGTYFAMIAHALIGPDQIPRGRMAPRDKTANRFRSPDDSSEVRLRIRRPAGEEKEKNKFDYQRYARSLARR